MHLADTYLQITPQCSNEALRATHYLHQDPATHDTIWVYYLESIFELLMINSLETPSAWISFVFLKLRIVLLLVNLEIKAYELAKSSVKLKLSAVYAQDDSYK